MPLFPWTDAAKEAKRLEQRSIDFDQLQDQTERNRDRVTRVRRSVCPSPEKPPEVVDVSEPACSMSGFVAINRPEQKAHDQTAAAPSKQEEVTERVPRTSGPTLEHKSEPALATSSIKEQSNAFSSVDHSQSKSQVCEEAEQKKQAPNSEKSQEQPAITLAQCQGSGGQNGDSESDEDSLPRLRTRRPPEHRSQSSADAASDSEEACAPSRRVRRPQRLPSPRPTTSPSPAPTCTPPVQLEDRNWAVVGIAGARQLHDITQYLTIWGKTTHRLPTLQANADGVYSIEVDGRICEIEAFDKPHVLGDTAELEVRWKSEWLYTWELSDARKEVVKFNTRRGSGPVTDPDHLPTYRSPEREADTTKRCTIDFAPKLHFTPQPDQDYTASLMWRCVERCEQRANHDKLSDNFIRACLDELPRQRLVLRTRWLIDQNSDDHTDLLECREEVLLRAFLNYVVGQARRSKCSYCDEHCGPFRKCVTRDTNYEGACTNCALAGRSKQCEYYSKGFWAIEDKMRAGTDAQNADFTSEVIEDADVHMDEDLCSSSPLPASGPQTQHANRSAVLTPPTSSPPQNLFAGAAKAGTSGQVNVDVSDLVEEVTTHLETLGDEQLHAGKDDSNTDSATLANLFGDSASALLGNDATLHNTSGSAEGFLSQPKSDAFRRLFEEVRRTADPNKEKKAIKRKRSTSPIDPTRRVQPSRQHKVARTVEQAETQCKRARHVHDNTPPQDPSGANEGIIAITSMSPPDGEESQQPSALDHSPQSMPIRSAKSIQPPSNCGAGSSAPQHAKFPDEQDRVTEPQVQLTQQPDYQPHADCSPRGPCIDPVLNPLPPKTDPESPVVIYRDRDQLFKKSELTDAELRYLLSIAPCNIINAVTQFWQEVEPEVKKHNCVGKRTKEWYLSGLWTHELNQIVRERCPLDPSRLGKPVVIDLTLDD